MTEGNINKEGLGRFLTAQDGKRGDYTLYELALKEIQEGKTWIRMLDSICLSSAEKKRDKPVDRFLWP